MRFRKLHSWSVTPREAVALQRQLADRVDSKTPLKKFRTIAGADVSYNRFSTTFHAGVVVLAWPELEIMETVEATADVRFPYVPGLLSFREAPVLLDAFAQLQCTPDVIVVDGQGVAHPRRFGIASHIGLWLSRPTIGCAKTLLAGTFDTLDAEKGCTAPLKHRQETVGMALRSKHCVKPIFISVGNGINLTSAVRTVLETCRGYRMPEPTRLAHLHVNSVRRRFSAAATNK